MMQEPAAAGGYLDSIMQSDYFDLASNNEYEGSEIASNTLSNMPSSLILTLKKAGHNIINNNQLIQQQLEDAA